MMPLRKMPLAWQARRLREKRAISFAQWEELLQAA
jgi:hypothetical protein